MRRVLLALLAAVGLTSATIAGSALPASGDTVEGVDASVEITTAPAEIAPPGAVASYTVTVSLTGLTPADVLVTNTATGGAVTGGSCGASCTVELDPVLGPASVDVGVDVTSNFDAGEVALTTVITLQDDDSDDVIVQDINPDNNSDRATTAVGGTAYDASVAIDDLVGEIAPAGSYGLYDVTISNGGPDAATLTITSTVAGGTLDAAHSDLGNCSGTVAECTLPALGPGASATIRLAVESGTSSGCAGASFADCVQLTSSASDDESDSVDTDPSNDSATETTPVTSTTTSSAFVPEGESLTFEANGQLHTLTVINAKGSGGGAIVRMTDPGVMTCGDEENCRGVHIEFDQGADGEAYEAETEVDSTGDHDPCRGLGSGSDCTEIYWRKLPGETMVKLPACGTEGADEPCLQQKYKIDGEIHYVTEMETDDPDLGLPDIPPVEVG